MSYKVKNLSFVIFRLILYVYLLSIRLNLFAIFSINTMFSNHFNKRILDFHQTLVIQRNRLIQSCK